MSYSSVSAKIESLGLKSSNKINVHTSNVNKDIDESNNNKYEEIDYTQENNIDYKKKSYSDEINSLLNSFNKALNDINKEIEPLQNEYDKAYNIITNPYTMNTNNILDRNAEICDRIKPELDSLKSQKLMLENYISQLEYELSLAPYKELMNTEDYQKFIKSYDSNYQNIDYITLASFDYNITAYIAEKSKDKSIDELLESNIHIIDKLAVVEYLVSNNKDSNIDDLIIKYPNFINEFNNYQFMSQEQRDMYHYLFNKKGENEANKYLDLISNSINQAHGAKMASDFINTLDLNDKGNLDKNLANFFGVSSKGLVDGMNTFGEGLANALINNSNLTANDYEKMIVLQYLKENSNYYDDVYVFNSALGNMIPSIASSAIVSFVATPAAAAGATSSTLMSSLAQNAGTMTGSTLMGISAGGNAKHSALTAGNSVISSSLYGILIGASESTLGYFLGGTTGISKSAGLTISSLLKEGTEEYLQEWIDVGLQAAILGNDINIEEVPNNALNSFVMGVLMAGLLNGGQKIVNVSINGVTQQINVDKVIEVLENNPNMSPEQALALINPNIVPDIEQKITVNNQVKLSKLNYDGVEQVVNKYNNDYKSAFADILYDLGAKKSVYETRLICRDLITYLESKGINAKQASLIIADSLTGAYNKRGFKTQSYDLAGNKILIEEQVNIKYANQVYTPAKVIKDISRLPIEFQKLVKSLRFYDTFSPNDFYREQQYGIKNFKASASAGNGNINFFDNTNYDFRTIVHELAHCYDLTYSSKFGVSGRISQSQMWLDAMKADEKISDIKAVTEYARKSNSVEDFAEAVSFYYTNPRVLDKFPNRKALLRKILPNTQPVTNNNVNTNSNVNLINYNTAVQILISNYGKEGALNQIENYLKSGNINYAIRDSNVRNILSTIPLNELKIYYNSINQKSVSVNSKISNNVNSNLKIGEVVGNAFSLLTKRYGKKDAIKIMNAYLSSGDLEYLPNYDGVRSSLAQIKIEDARNYIRSINNNSLNLNNLYK